MAKLYAEQYKEHDNKEDEEKEETSSRLDDDP